MRGGDVSVSMAYSIVIAFIFLTTIVIMNLLNGLAVSDTQAMLTDSKIQSQISRIETMRYFESVYLNGGKMSYFVSKDTRTHNCFNINHFLRKYLIPTKLFLFQSEYLSSTKRLAFPLKEEVETEHSCAPCLIYIRSWLTSNDINSGSEVFLGKARKILIRLRKATRFNKRQKELRTEMNQLAEVKRFEKLKIQALTDQISNLDNKLEYLMYQMLRDYE